MATIKGIWAFTDRVRVWRDVLFSQNIQGFLYPKNRSINRISISMTTSDMGSETYKLKLEDTTNDYTLTWANHDHSPEEQYATLYMLIDFGEIEQEVSEEFYTWFIASAIECTMDNMLGIWEFKEDSRNGIPAIEEDEEVPIKVRDLDGDIYTAMRWRTSDMGDIKTELYSDKYKEWVTAYIIPF